MNDIYFISGLGADHRLFENQIQAGINLKILPWKIPLKNETIESYAKRISEGIKNKDKFIIGGVSFGGIIAIEIAKIMQPEKTILISSIKSSEELPFYIKMLKYFPVYKILPAAFIKKSGLILRRLLGEMNKEEFNTFKKMLNDSDSYFIKWAIDKIVHWNSKEYPAAILHIHGTKDHIFPFRFINAPVPIKAGSHIMIATCSEPINRILKKELSLP